LVAILKYGGRQLPNQSPGRFAEIYWVFWVKLLGTGRFGEKYWVLGGSEFYWEVLNSSWGVLPNKWMDIEKNWVNRIFY